MWLALQTVTTVGYGDVTPKDAAGKFVAAVVMLEGIAFLAIITAAITSTFVSRAAQERLATEEDTHSTGESRIGARLDDLGQQLNRLESMIESLAGPQPGQSIELATQKPGVVQMEPASTRGLPPPSLTQRKGRNDG